MKEMLINKGWRAFHECHCGGVHRVELDHPDLPGIMIKIYPKRQKFKVSRAGKRAGEGTDLTLETFLNELVTKAVC